MFQDVDVFINKLQKVDGFGDAGEYLTNIVKSKKVEPDAPTAPASTITTATNGTDGSKPPDVESEKKTSSEETPQE